MNFAAASNCRAKGYKNTVRILTPFQPPPYPAPYPAAYLAPSHPYLAPTLPRSSLYPVPIQPLAQAPHFAPYVAQSPTWTQDQAAIYLPQRDGKSR